MTQAIILRNAAKQEALGVLTAEQRDELATIKAQRQSRLEQRRE